MPVYNEAACVRKVIEEWLGALRTLRMSFVLHVIDDGSNDDTPQLLDALAVEAEEIQVTHQVNAGHGAAILHGYREATGAWVFQTDSDGELPASNFKRLWEEKDEVDGVRGLRPPAAGPGYRSLIRKLEPLAVALLFGRWHRDLNVPCRLYRREALQCMLDRLPPMPFAPNALLTAIAPTLHLHVSTVEVDYVGRAAGSSKLKWFSLSKACIKVMLDLLRTRVRCL